MIYVHQMVGSRGATMWIYGNHGAQRPSLYNNQQRLREKKRKAETIGREKVV